MKRIFAILVWCLLCFLLFTSFHKKDAPQANPFLETDKKVVVARLGLVKDFIPVNQKPAGEIEWSKVIGGGGYDNFVSVINTSDGGYIAAGSTKSLDGDVTTSYGGHDILVVKFGADGIKQWVKIFGGSGDDLATSIVATSDGYAIVGYSFSKDGDIISNQGYTDICVLKIGLDGTLQWVKTYGGSNNDVANSIVATYDGYVIAGFTGSNDGDIISNHGGEDIFVMKLSLDGTKQWVKTYGGSNNDVANSIVATSDGYAIAGYTDSKDGDITSNHGGNDIFIMKLRLDGTQQWFKTYGGSDDDLANSLAATSDGYVLTGNTVSSDGDIVSNHGGFDLLIMKLGLDGTKLWTKTYGGSGSDYASSIIATSNGYAIAGDTYNIDADSTSNHGSFDLLIMKLGLDGTKLWTKTYGGTDYDYAFSIISTTAGYVVAGETQSNNGDVSGNHGLSDAWLLKIKE